MAKAPRAVCLVLRCRPGTAKGSASFARASPLQVPVNC